MAVVAKETRGYVDKGQAVIRRGVIDTHTLWQVMRIERILIASIMAAFLCLAMLYLHVADRRYAVRLVVTGVTVQKEGSSALEDIGSLAGVDLGGPSSNPLFKMFVGALRSPFAAQAIAADPELLKAMFPREWSAKENRWREPPSKLRSVGNAIRWFFGGTVLPWSPPGVARVFDYLKDELKVVPDAKSGVVTMEIDSQNPPAAERILLTLNNAVDERMRQRDLARATTDVDYLQQRLANVNVQEYRAALVTNLVQQEKMRMLASAPLAYVSDALGNPLVSAKPVSPVPTAVLLMALFLGWLVGVGVAMRKHRRR